MPFVMEIKLLRRKDDAMKSHAGMMKKFHGLSLRFLKNKNKNESW